MKIEMTNRKGVAPDAFLGTPPGGTAIVTTTGGELLSGLDALLTGNSRDTEVKGLVRDGDVYSYKVTVQGYSLTKLEEFLQLLATSQIEQFLTEAAAFTSSFPMRDDD